MKIANSKAAQSVPASPITLSPWRLVPALVLCAGAFTLDAAAVEPSQVPLTSRVGDTPPPNVMITLDDSGSMNSDFMPAGAVTINGVSVRLDSSIHADRLGAFLNDIRKSNAGQLGAYIPAVKGSTARVYQMQFRSPDVNTTWYNPDVRYLPWLKSTPKTDGTGEYMANAVPAAAYWDPMKTNLGTFDLTANRTNVNTTWCVLYNSCGSATLNYNPGLFYRLKSGMTPDAVGNFVEYDINDASNYSPTRSSKPTTRTDCVSRTTQCTQAEERVNFANWFTYHRMREALAKGAVTESLFGFQNKMRVGWGRINGGSTSRVDGNLSFNVVKKGIRNLDKTQLQGVLEGIQGYTSTGGTPLRNALDSVGPYFKDRTDAYSPWLTDIGTAGSGKLSCRRSINLLTTDGYYNDGYTAAGDLTNVDGAYDYSSAAANPGGYSPTRYIAQRPYIDGRTKNDTANIAYNSLTDAAMRWYIQDLDTSVDNKVAPTDSDIAFWQHLTQFTIGIGVKGTLDASTPAAKAATLAALSDPNGTTIWPKPSTDPQKIDDLWHAAVNTGGDFYSVKNGAELSAAITNIFGKATGVDAREAGVATVASTLSSSNLKFVPQYKSGAWYGDVYAYQLDTNGDVSNPNARWRASTKLPAATARNLYTWSGSAGQEFKSTILSAADKAIIGSDDLINYIRGDTSKEGNSLTFRPRGGQLIGDIINSPPVYVRDLLDSSYGSLSDTTEAAAYSTFLAAKKARTDGALVVGGNAGIFHVLRGSDGVETFGYVPRAGFANLNLVASKTYGTNDNFHRFFVDGPTAEADAYITPKGDATPRWANMLVGSMGAGGKSVFALNVPTADPTLLNANSVQWELNNHDDLGFVMNDMRTGKIKGGTNWYAFIGNGPYSTNGNAALLVVDLQTGAVVRSITVPTSGANGLGGVRLLRNTNMEVYAAYAGDLQGNLWRFDFPTGDAASWVVSFNQTPLFKATDNTGKPQPIVVAPAVVPHPTRGQVVTFGTGRLIDTADSLNTDAQTYYGVWDDTVVNSSGATVASPFYAASQSGGTAPYRSVLVQQTISGNTVTGTTGDSAGVVYYSLSSNTVDWSQKKGWYIDLDIQAGQRTVYPAQTILNFVYFSSIVPAAKAAECDFTTGTGYNFVVDAVTGAAVNGPVFDTNGDGIVSSTDETVAGYQTLADGVDKLLTNQTGLVNEYSTNRCLPDLNAKCPADSCLVVIVNTTNQAQELCVPGPSCTWQDPQGDPRCLCPDGVTHKTSADDTCAKVITDRVWRQIMNPPHP